MLQGTANLRFSAYWHSAEAWGAAEADDGSSLLEANNIQKVQYKHLSTKQPMELITILGLTAALFTTISLLPQLLKLWKTKSTNDISVGMFMLFCGGVLLWFIYGLFLHDYPIIIANGLAFIQALVILVFKVKYK